MTDKPLSTISYNTEKWLKRVLDELLQEHIIQTYMYIFHKGEDGDKDHFHVRIEPNKRIDPMSIKELFIEPDPNNPKPLNIRPWRKSKEEDWFLYVVHDKDYLALKYGGGEKGEKIPYSWKDIIVPNDYDAEIAFIRAKSSLTHTTSNMARRIASGETALDLILEGENPHQVNAVSRAFCSNDFETLNSKFLDLSSRFISLSQAIEKEGFTFNFLKLGDDFICQLMRSHE